MSARTTFIYSKLSGTDMTIMLDLAPRLNTGETLTSVTPVTLSPDTTPALTASQVSLPTDTTLLVNLSGGVPQVSYGIVVDVITNIRVFKVILAIVVLSDSDTPYTTSNPEAFSDLIDTIEAGQPALGTGVFSFPPDVDPTGGHVTWEFLDSEGTVYSAGNAHDYNIRSNGVSNTVIARCVVNVPTTVPPTLDGQKYQIRYTLHLTPSVPNGQTSYVVAENITVIGLNTVPLGVQPNIELVGNQAQLTLVTESLYDTVTVKLFKDNDMLGSMDVTSYERCASGYYYAAQFDTSALPVDLESYTVVWSYSNRERPAIINNESAPLWIVNPTILQAIDDVKSKINKARTTLYGTPDMLFPPTTIATWLRRARDNFNGSYGVLVNFTMLNAKGAIREYWLMYTELLAIESQYLAEGEKAFNFSGASTSLDVDRTGYLDSYASKLQSRLDNEFKNFKQNLIMKGATKGDGSVDPSKLQRGAIGSVGITITPASPWNLGNKLQVFPIIR